MTLNAVRMNKGKASLTTIAAVVLITLFILFLLQNSTTVDISFLFWRLTMSRIILLFGSLAVGVILGLLAGWEIFGRDTRR